MKPDPYTHKKLLEYVMSMLAQGWDADTIRRELKWAGHSPKAIEAVLHEVLVTYGKDVHAHAEDIREAKEEDSPEEHEEKGKRPPKAVEELDEEPPAMSSWASLFLMKSTSVEKTFSALYFILVFVLIIWTGLSTGSPVGNVFAGFLPIILTVLTVFALSDYFEDDKRWILFAVPVAWCVLFVLAASGGVALFKVLDVQNLVMLNFTLGIVYSGMIYFLGNLERGLVEEERMKAVKKKVVGELTGEERRERHGQALTDLDSVMNELEDAARHLSMAVNRVYSAKHAGSPAMREGIAIPAEWFQDYKHARKDDTDSRLKAAKKAVTLAYERLMDMKRHEKDVFGPAALELKDLTRDAHGRSKIVDVLVANEKEPVHDHYQRALDCCSKAIAALKHAGLLPQH